MLPNLITLGAAQANVTHAAWQAALELLLVITT